MMSRSIPATALVALTGMSLLAAEGDGTRVTVGGPGELSLAAVMREAQMVSTASRYDEDLRMAPNVIYAYSQDRIEKLGLQTLGDLLDITPGFKVFHGALQYTAQVRGVVSGDNEKYTVMLNGHSINNMVEPSFLNGPLNLRVARSVEVLVGPGSVLYGADTMAGTVNVLTRQMNGGEGSISVGNLGRIAVTAIGGTDLDGGGNLTISLTGMKRAGYDAADGIDPTRINGPGTQMSGASSLDRLYAVDRLGDLRPSNLLQARAVHKDLAFQWISYNESMTGYDQGQDGVRNDTINAADGTWDHVISDELSVFVIGRYDNQRMVRSALGDGNATPGVTTSLDLSEVKYGGEIGLRLHNQFQFFQAGVQGTLKQHDFAYIYRWYPESPTTTGSTQNNFTTPGSPSHVIGVYASEDITPSERWKITLAARGDKDSILGDHATVHLSPRAAVAWQVTDVWTTKVMYNTATRMPSFAGSPANIYYDPAINTTLPPGYRKGPADRPERLTAYEFQNILARDELFCSLNGYYQRIDDFIQWGRPWTNVGQYHGIGVEADARAMVAQDVLLWANGAYSHATFTTPYTVAGSFVDSALPPTFVGMTQDELPWTPAVTANLGLQVTVGWNTTIAPTVRAFFHELTYDTTSPGHSTTSPEKEIYNRAYLDLTATTRDICGLHGLDLGVTVRNLTNNRLPVPQSYQQYLIAPEPLVVDLTVNYSF